MPHPVPNLERQRPGHAETPDANQRALRERAPTLPHFLTPEEAAALLRTTRKAIYVMVARGQLPGVTRLGRRLLFRTDVLLHFLHQKSAPSPKE